MRMRGSVACGLLAGVAAAFLVATSAHAEDPGAPTPTPAEALLGILCSFGLVAIDDESRVRFAGA
jgi:hypothetical protein